MPGHTIHAGLQAALGQKPGRGGGGGGLLQNVVGNLILLLWFKRGALIPGQDAGEHQILPFILKRGPTNDATCCSVDMVQQQMPTIFGCVNCVFARGGGEGVGL